MDADLYNKIISLPFLTSEDKFKDIFNEVKDSEHITENQSDYLEEKFQSKKMWARCFLKDRFIGGVSTTSRVEGFHAKQKAYLTSNSNLQQIFHSFRSIEKIQVSNFKEEFSCHKGGALIENINSLSELKKKISEYVFKKIHSRFCTGLNYKHEPLTSYSW